MAVTPIGATSTAETTTATWTADPPPGTDTAGDLIVAILNITSNTITLLDQSQPFRWLSYGGRQLSSGNFGRGLYIGTLDSDGSAPASYDFTLSGSASGSTTLLRYRGGSGGVRVEPCDVHPDSDAATASWNIPGFTPRAGGLAVAIMRAYTNTGTAVSVSLSSGWTQRTYRTDSTEFTLVAEKDAAVSGGAAISALTVTPAIAHDLDEAVRMMMVLSDAAPASVPARGPIGAETDAFSTSLGVAIPADVVVGDALETVIVVRDAAADPTPPDGTWTLLGRARSASAYPSNVAVYVYRKDIDEAGDIPGGPVTFTVPAAKFASTRMAVIRNGAAAVNVVGSPGEVGVVGTSHNVPGITTLVNGALVRYFAGAQQGAGGYWPTLTDSERAFKAGTAQYSTVAVTGFHEIQHTAGATGDVAFSTPSDAYSAALAISWEAAEDPFPSSGGGGGQATKLLLPL